jgi:hypothetical protein
MATAASKEGLVAAAKIARDSIAGSKAGLQSLDLRLEVRNRRLQLPNLPH